LGREAVLANPHLDGRPLRRVRLPGNVLVLGLCRDGDILAPYGDTVLRRGDVLMLVGHPDELHQAAEWLAEPGDSR
jgi:Trk K+ transport system NAD-binding subunit